MNSLTDNVSSVEPLVDMWIQVNGRKVLPLPPPLSLGSVEIPDLIHFHNNILIYWFLVCPFVLIIFYSLKPVVQNISKNTRILWLTCQQIRQSCTVSMINECFSFASLFRAISAMELGSLNSEGSQSLVLWTVYEIQTPNKRNQSQSHFLRRIKIISNYTSRIYNCFDSTQFICSNSKAYFGKTRRC